MQRTKPWRKLWLLEPCELAQLSLFARALATLLLRATDDAGEIALGGKSPADAVGRYFGATPGERRQLKIALAELCAAGIVHHDLAHDLLRLSCANCERTSPKIEKKPDLVHGSRTENSDSGVRTPADVPDKPAESLETEALKKAPREEVEKRREDIERGRARDPNPTSRPSKAPDPDPEPDPWPAPKSDPDERLLAECRSALLRAYQRRYETETKMPWQAYSANQRHIESVAGWLAAVARKRPDGNASELAEKLLTRYFGDPWAISASWPWSHLAKDPAKYARPSKPPPAAAEPEPSSARLLSHQPAPKLAYADAVECPAELLKDVIGRMGAA